MFILITCQDVGVGDGKYFAVNVPLKDGITDESYENLFKPVHILHVHGNKARLSKQ